MTIYVDILSMSYADLRQKYKVNRSLYLDAVKRADPAVIEFLLATAPPPQDAIHLSIELHCNDIAKTLVSHSSAWKYLVKTAVEYGNMEILKYMYDANNDIKVASMWFKNAAASGHLDTVEFCITILNTAPYIGRHYMDIIINRSTKMAKLLIDHNCFRPACEIVCIAYTSNNMDIVRYTIEKHPTSDTTRSLMTAWKNSDMHAVDFFIDKLPRRAKIERISDEALLLKILKTRGNLGYSTHSIFEFTIKEQVQRKKPIWKSIFEYLKNDLSLISSKCKACKDIIDRLNNAS